MGKQIIEVRHYDGDRRDQTIGVLVVSGLILVLLFWKWILLGLGILALLFIGYVAWRWYADSRDALAVQCERISAQADIEHEALLRGDPYGVHGEYSPACDPDPPQ